MDATEIIDARASADPFEQYDNLALDEDGGVSLSCFWAGNATASEGTGGSGADGSGPGSRNVSSSMLGRTTRDDLGRVCKENRVATNLGTAALVQEMARRLSSSGKDVPAGEWEVDLRICRSF